MAEKVTSTCEVFAASPGGGNEVTAKASLLDVSGASLTFGSGLKREPFLTASLRARMKAKAQGCYVDSALEQIKKVEQ
uniref:hypothetical protein n=1 Tax=Paratractidigestivibacter sp. TaxID=2847316 RepID=UPI002AC8FB85